MNGRIQKRAFALLVALVLVFTLSATASASGPRKELIPGGMAFGVKFFTEGCIVIGTTGVESASGLCSPAKDVGLRPLSVCKIDNHFGKPNKHNINNFSPVHLAYQNVS